MQGEISSTEVSRSRERVGLVLGVSLPGAFGRSARTETVRRHHIHPRAVQRAFKKALRKVGWRISWPEESQGW